MHGYVFQVDFGIDGVVLRRYFDVTKYIGKTYDEYITARRARAKLGGTEFVMDDVLANLNAMLVGGQLSARFSDAGGNYLVKTEEPLTADELAAFLTAKQRAGELKEFLEQVKL